MENRTGTSANHAEIRPITIEWKRCVWMISNRSRRNKRAKDRTLRGRDIKSAFDVKSKSVL